ncbi:MarR family winged helix-turn-helix transcriptional regulator [Photobacterium sp. TY1-4]|uniref:MarR family winged helix-turn-helix transcriptional regulator n=1 Tax=Photobacterium sp. TY1-4 TaxID=2899122 RepID=UPI0021BF0C12|nr:MarR family transcriptional regulator [Photobacterium sp. TY1-4]UXI03669.1 MarR family transcriptional regulator [Photobacterium sp. TY1-4]
MSDAQARLSAMALTSFALNGQFLKIAEQLAAPAGLTATRWQVLGAVLHEPLTQAEIARRMGITRQSVRRTANQLMDDGLLGVVENPSLRKAKLLQPTEAGFAAIGKIGPQHACFARSLEGRLGHEKMAQIADTLTVLHAALEALVEPQSAE